jgi:hypothetical protein
LADLFQQHRDRLRRMVELRMDARLRGRVDASDLLQNGFLDVPRRTVIDGPFAETKELVAGFWLWEVKDTDEAVAWVKRYPNPMPGPSEIEIRPLNEITDLLPESDTGGHGNP